MYKAALFSLSVVFMLAIAAPASSGEIGVQVVFTDSEASIIRAYYKDHPTTHNGKNKKAKGLPPGIAKNLQRGKPLPPGIAKQALPSGLVKQLPPAPDGYERIAVAGKVLLVEIATQVIRDVLEEAVLG